MKTLKTLLALSLLVSSFAPVCAMENAVDAAVPAQAAAPVEPTETPVEVPAAPVAEVPAAEPVEVPAAPAEVPAVAVEAPAAPAVEAAPVVEEGLKARATARVKAFATNAKGILFPAIKNDDADKTLNKAGLAKAALAWTAIAATVSGLGYAVYNLIFADEANDEEVVTEEAQAPVVVEPQVKTVEEATEAPVVVKPAVSSKQVNQGPRRNRPGACKKRHSKKVARAKRCSKGCNKGGCR